MDRSSRFRVNHIQILFLAAAPAINKVIHHPGMRIRPILVFFLIIMSARTLFLGIITYFPHNSTSTVPYYCPDNSLCKFLEVTSRSAAAGERVFVLHAYRYYLRPDLFACSSQVEEYAILEPLARRDSPDFWSEIYRRGFKLIIFEKHLAESRYHFGNLPSPDLAPPWMNIKLLYTNTDETQQIFKIETTNPPTQPEISCRQDAAGRWLLTR